MHAREFGRYGILQVRYGKAMRASPPKRRSVLTAFEWSGEIVADWLERGHGYMTDGLDHFPSERDTHVSETVLRRRFNRYCEDLGLSPGLDIHLLRTGRTSTGGHSANQSPMFPPGAGRRRSGTVPLRRLSCTP